MPNGLSNRSPRLLIGWDGEKLGITGQEGERILYEGGPRIVLGGASGIARELMASAATSLI